MTAIIVAGLVFVGARYGVRVLSHSFMVESTDDAFTEGTVAPVSPKIAGRVLEVLVHENQQVKKGDVLVKLDDRDQQVKNQLKAKALEGSKTNDDVLKLTVGVVKAQVETSRAQEAKAKADLAAAKATADRAAADYKRAQELVTKSAVSAQDADAMRAASIEAAEKLKAAQDGVVAAEASVKMSLAMVDAFKAYAGGSEVKTQQAALDVEQAKLDLSYTHITAAMDGRVTRKGVEAGAFVQPGQNLMAIVTPNIWVIGNFKETQLRQMRAGQPAEVRIDAHPDHVYRAHVDSIQAGSGARFSLFPPENASGNFVKVVQRVPVKIVFDEPLDPAIVAGPGLSVDPEVIVGKELLAPVVQLGIAAGIAFLIFVLIVSRGGKPSAGAA